MFVEPWITIRAIVCVQNKRNKVKNTLQLNAFESAIRSLWIRIQVELRLGSQREQVRTGTAVQPGTSAPLRGIAPNSNSSILRCFSSPNPLPVPFCAALGFLLVETDCSLLEQDVFSSCDITSFVLEPNHFNVKTYTLSPLFFSSPDFKKCTRKQMTVYSALYTSTVACRTQMLISLMPSDDCVAKPA